ncbi:MAG: hypothetical protein ABIJ03_03120 [Patescibacteria group bacterium]|nr:hypothetical protein [Patescibacteria group bacterium]
MIDNIPRNIQEQDGNALPSREAEVAKLANTPVSTLSEAEDVWKNLDPFGDDDSEIVNGQIVSPGNVKIGETSAQPAKERAWLKAISEANDANLPDTERGRRVQEVLDRALANGVPKEVIHQRLDELGIQWKPKTETGVAEAGETHLAKINRQIEEMKAGRLSQGDFQTSINKAKLAGVPVDQIRGVLEKAGIKITEALSPERITELKLIAAQKAKEYYQAEEEALFDAIASKTTEATQTNTPPDLKIERSRLTDEIGHRFAAHGIAKGSRSEQLDTLLRLLASGIDPSRTFHTADLFRSDENEIAFAVGAAGPYDTGSFIVLGEPKSIDQSTNNRDIAETGVAGVLVNREWYDAIPDLQRAYPNVRFIRADQMRDKLTEWVQSIDQK